MALDTTKLDDLAGAPQLTRTDEGTVQERQADDALTLDAYNIKKNYPGPPFGMHVARIRFGGTVAPR